MYGAYSVKVNIRDFSAIRILEPSNPAAAELRLRTHGHRHQSICHTQVLKCTVYIVLNKIKERY